MESVAPPGGWVTAGPDVPPMPLTLLRLPRTNITRSRFPAIDFHVHARELTGAPAYLSFIKLMDSIGVGAIVNLNGGRGEALDTALKAAEPYRDRVATFITFSPEGINELGWSQKFAAEMERAFKAGALGMKVSKTLGQEVKNPDGSFIQADDPRLDPIWAMAAKYERPVMIHISDSIGRFYPIGPKNERYEAGLWRQPGDTSGNLQRSGPPYEVIEKARENMHRKHPKTRFVNAHLAMLSDPALEMPRDLRRALLPSGANPHSWRIPRTRPLEHLRPRAARGGTRKVYYQNALRHLPSLRPSIEKQLAAR